MKVKFSKNAIKFLNALSTTEQERIREKLKILVLSIEENGSIPFQELDIKNLKGEWKSFIPVTGSHYGVTSLTQILTNQLPLRRSIFNN